MDASAVIERLGLAPHPEGGHYKETYREGDGAGRGALSAIYFLLRADGRSRWHRVDAAEVWLHHAGAPLDLIVHDGDTRRTVRLGTDLAAGERPQAVVPKGAWQTAVTSGAWTLVSCVVAPAFTFDGFELPDDPAFEP